MRVVLDACILFPTVMREILIGAAEAGFFTPLWSDKILAEWQHTAGRFGNDAAIIARAEIALLNRNWPDASVSVSEELIAGLSLPDENDRHVLAAAIAGNADSLMTKNLKDFPGRTLARHHVLLREPDEFLLELALGDDAGMVPLVRKVQLKTEQISGRPQPIRALLKRARLPRLGKFMDALPDV